MKEGFSDLINWSDTQLDRVKHLQDVCLDYSLDDEARDILKRLVSIQEQIEDLSSKAQQMIF